jgi:hypothetical protein
MAVLNHAALHDRNLHPGPSWPAARNDAVGADFPLRSRIRPAGRLCGLVIRRAAGAGTPQVHHPSTAGTSPGPVPGRSARTPEGDDGAAERGLSAMMAAGPRPQGELTVRRQLSRSLTGTAARTRSPSADPCCRHPHRDARPATSSNPGRLPHLGQHGTAPAPQGRCGRSPPPGQGPPRPRPEPDRPARSARPGLPDAVAGQLAHHQGGIIPARVPGTSTPPAKVRATRARSARPAIITLSQTAVPAISAPVRPRPHHPRASHRAAGWIHGDARSTQRRTPSRNMRPARPVRGRPWKADGAHRPS